MNIKWKTILAIVLLGLATYFNWMWFWGIFFFYWVYLGLQQKQTYLVENIEKENNPFLYWILLLCWLLFGFYLTLPYLLPYLPESIQKYLFLLYENSYSTYQ